MIVPSTQDLERAIRAYVAKGSGLERACVIPGNQSGPVPKTAFATVLLITGVPDGLAWTLEEYVANRTYPDATFTDGPTFDVQAFESTELTYSVQWFRNGAADMARRFSVWARGPLGIAEAARRGLTFYRTGPIRNLDGIDKEFWEERRSLDLVLGIVSTVTEDAGLFDSVELTVFPDRLSHLEDPDDRIPVSIPGDLRED